MNYRFAALLLAILVATIPTFAQTTPVPAPTPKVEKTEKVTIKTKVTKEEYASMLKKLKAGDLTVDFARLRLAYTETKDYSPYGGAEQRGQMSAEYKAGYFDTVIKTANSLLDTNYVDLTAHYWAALAYKQLNKTKEAELHVEILKKLLAAIQENDGLSAKTAMISIGINEQYFVMNYLGFERQSKALVREEGSIFDVHTSFNKTTNETRKFYFNIDKVFGKF